MPLNSHRTVTKYATKASETYFSQNLPVMVTGPEPMTSLNLTSLVLLNVRQRSTLAKSFCPRVSEATGWRCSLSLKSVVWISTTLRSPEVGEKERNNARRRLAIKQLKPSHHNQCSLNKIEGLGDKIRGEKKTKFDDFVLDIVIQHYFTVLTKYVFDGG